MNRYLFCSCTVDPHRAKVMAGLSGSDRERPFRIPGFKNLGSLEVIVSCGLWLSSLALAQNFPLSEALNQIERAPEVVQSEQKLRQAEADLQLARTQAGLQISAGGTASYTWATQTIASVGTSLSLNLSLPLGRTSAPLVAVRQAELAIDAARATLRQTGSEMARRVVQAYSQALLAESQQTQSGLLLELAQKQVVVVETQQQLGAATPSQTLNARLAASTAQQNFSRAENDLREKRLELASLLGLVTLPGRPVPPTGLPSLPTPEQLSAHLEQSPALAQAVVALEQAKLALFRASTGSSFTVSLGYTSDQFDATVGLSIPDYTAQVALILRPTVVNPPGQGNTISLGANVLLWDSGGTEAARQSALIGLRFAQNALERTRHETQRLLQSALEQARLDAQNLPVQQEAARVAERGLAEVRQRLALGAVTALDELAARASLEAAQGTLLAAQMRILEDLYQLYAVLGVGSL